MSSDPAPELEAASAPDDSQVIHTVRAVICSVILPSKQSIDFGGSFIDQRGIHLKFCSFRASLDW